MQDGADAADSHNADASRPWASAPDADLPEGPAASAEAPFDSPSSELADAADPAVDAAFAELLRTLRALPGPCAPPVGEGAFDILYASAREIVVWFVPAKDGVAQREVAIPARLARAAWEVVRRGEPVDETTLQALAAGAAGGRWLLALFAQLPTVEVRLAPAGADSANPSCLLVWRGDAEGA